MIKGAPRTWNSIEIVGKSKTALTMGLRGSEGQRGCQGQISRHVLHQFSRTVHANPHVGLGTEVPTPHHQVEAMEK